MPLNRTPQTYGEQKNIKSLGPSYKYKLWKFYFRHKNIETQDLFLFLFCCRKIIFLLNFGLRYNHLGITVFQRFWRKIISRE